MYQRLLSLLCLITIGMGVWGQDEQAARDSIPDEKTARHLVTAAAGFTFVPVSDDVNDTEANGLFVLSLGLEYFYQLAKRWELGAMVNFELGHYLIVDNQVERENAILMALVGKFNISDHWGVFTGGGIEIDPYDQVGVFRLGTEYSIDLRKNWVLIPKFYFDFKGSYDTWSLQFSFGKRF